LSNQEFNMQEDKAKLVQDTKKLNKSPNQKENYIFRSREELEIQEYKNIGHFLGLEMKKTIEESFKNGT
jgi:hypothetical protein